MISRLFLNGLTSWPALDNIDFGFLLADSTWTPSASDEWVADVIGELTDPSYSRVLVTGASITQTTNLFGACVRYDCDDPTFPALDGITEPAWLALFRTVTTDADSPLLGVWPVAWVPNATDFTPQVSASGLHEHNLGTDAFWTTP